MRYTRAHHNRVFKFTLRKTGGDHFADGLKYFHCKWLIVSKRASFRDPILLIKKERQQERKGLRNARMTEQVFSSEARVVSVRGLSRLCRVFSTKLFPPSSGSNQRHLQTSSQVHVIYTRQVFNIHQFSNCPGTGSKH